MNEFSHLKPDGSVRMVDVTEKAVTDRVAVAEGWIRMAPTTIDRIREGSAPKGNVLETARIAAIVGAKRTSDWIPLCHPLQISGVDVSFDLSDDRVTATARVRVTGQTGVEMEALAAVSVGLLTIYDMCKAVDKEMVIESVRLMKKSGGRSGTYERKD